MQSSRFTVKADGKQNSRLVNFVPEQRLPFAKSVSFTENGWEGVKLVSKIALKKWNTNFRLEHSVRKKKNRTTLSDVPLLPEIFHWNDPKSRVPFSFQPNFPDTFCTW